MQRGRGLLGKCVLLPASRAATPGPTSASFLSPGRARFSALWCGSSMRPTRFELTTFGLKGRRALA